MKQNTDDIPIELGMALATNDRALKHFCALSEAEQQEIIRCSRYALTTSEMELLVDKLL